MGCFVLSWQKELLSWKWAFFYFFLSYISMIFCAVTATLLLRSLTFFMVKFFWGEEDEERALGLCVTFYSPMTREELNCVILIMLLPLAEDCAFLKTFSNPLWQPSFSSRSNLMPLVGLPPFYELSNKMSTKVPLCIIFAELYLFIPHLDINDSK